MANEKSVEPLPVAPVVPVKPSAAAMSNNNKYEHGGDVDVDAEARLRAFTLGLKQQADQLLLAERHKDALPLYRDLLMHLTKSQVKVRLAAVAVSVRDVPHNVKRLTGARVYRYVGMFT